MSSASQRGHPAPSSPSRGRPLRQEPRRRGSPYSDKDVFEPESPLPPRTRKYRGKRQPFGFCQLFGLSSRLTSIHLLGGLLAFSCLRGSPSRLPLDGRAARTSAAIMFLEATTSLSPPCLQEGQNTLLPSSSIRWESQFGHFEDVPLGLT